ncbi:hypothetical protein CBM2609_A140080 [Cupriavidus taiwanensis]|nr:hypothetical protein CBM2604_A120079 [Cupriavidus taiwanensis]SOZ25355.1 hypothetical protein CBM2609_A140080 [Cupriavidus taiwanensis]
MQCADPQCGGNLGRARLPDRRGQRGGLYLERLARARTAGGLARLSLPARAAGDRGGKRADRATGRAHRAPHGCGPAAQDLCRAAAVPGHVYVVEGVAGILMIRVTRTGEARPLARRHRNNRLQCRGTIALAATSDTHHVLIGSTT